MCGALHIALRGNDYGASEMPVRTGHVLRNRCGEPMSTYFRKWLMSLIKAVDRCFPLWLLIYKQRQLVVS